MLGEAVIYLPPNPEFRGEFLHSRPRKNVPVNS